MCCFAFTIDVSASQACDFSVRQAGTGPQRRFRHAGPEPPARGQGPGERNAQPSLISVLGARESSASKSQISRGAPDVDSFVALAPTAAEDFDHTFAVCQELKFDMELVGFREARIA